MMMDGIHAFATGDYFTPRSGAYAGRLGPWSNIIQAIGLDPRSPLVKGLFVAQGIVTITLLACYWLKLKWSKMALKIAAFAELWYFPTGTIGGILVLVLLFLP